MSDVNRVMFDAAVIRAEEAGEHTTNEEWAIQYAAAEIESLTTQLEQRNEELENFVASGVHTCSQTCKRPLCVLRRENRALCQRLHMAEEQIRECRQYLRLDDRKLAVGHIDAYFKLPAIDQATGGRGMSKSCPICAAEPDYDGCLNCTEQDYWNRIAQLEQQLAEAVTTDNTKVSAWLLEENAQLREIDRLAGEADMTAVDMGDVVWVRAEEWFALHKALEEEE